MYLIANWTVNFQSIEQARAYRNYVSRAIEAGPEDTKEPRRKLLSVADQSLAYSEAAYRLGNNDGGDRAKEIGIRVLDIAISAAPIALWIVAPQAGAIIATAALISWSKDYYEAQTGRGFLTGEPVQGFYRGMAILGAAMIPFGGAAKGSVTIAKDIELLGDIWKFEKTAEETAVIAKNVEMAEGILDSAKKFGTSTADEVKSYTNLIKEIGEHNPKDIVQFERLKAELVVEEIKGAKVVGSAMKEDVMHRSASYMLDIAAKEGKLTSIRGDFDGIVKNLLQVEAELNGNKGVFEWIVSAKGLEHQRFIKGGKITGFPNQNPNTLP